MRFVDRRFTLFEAVRLIGAQGTLEVTTPESWAEPGNIFHVHTSPWDHHAFLITTAAPVRLIDAATRAAEHGYRDPAHFIETWQATYPPFDAARVTYWHQVLRITPEAEDAMLGITPRTGPAPAVGAVLLGKS